MNKYLKDAAFIQGLGWSGHITMGVKFWLLYKQNFHGVKKFYGYEKLEVVKFPQKLKNH